MKKRNPHKVGDYIIGQGFKGKVSSVAAYSVKINDDQMGVPLSLIKHNIWPVGENVPEAPSQIKDRNGIVVLQLCRHCGRAEGELDKMECKPC